MVTKITTANTGTLEIVERKVRVHTDVFYGKVLVTFVGF